MKAAVLYEANTPLVVEELDLDEPGPGEVLVKSVATGVCHSDYHVVKGDWERVALPSVLGHEAAGVVEAVGPQVTGVEPGDHVVLTWKGGCGRCEMCQQGYLSVCDLMPSVASKPRVSPNPPKDTDGRREEGRVASGGVGAGQGAGRGWRGISPALATRRWVRELQGK